MKNNKAITMSLLLGSFIFFSAACGHKGPPAPADGKPSPKGAPGYSEKQRRGY